MNGKSSSKVTQKSPLGRGIDRISRERAGDEDAGDVNDVLNGTVSDGNGYSSERCLRFGDVWSKVVGDG
jgi:hypothetical protein